MNWYRRLRIIPNAQKYRYVLILATSVLLLAPLALVPSLVGNPDLCGPLCMRRFFLFFPGMGGEDLARQVELALVGVSFFAIILLVTFFFGRIWCSYLCPVGGVPELLSRLSGERWKLEYRWLPQIPIRYGYLLTFVLLMPMLGVSACTLCNFVTVPRVFQALSGDWQGIAFLVSTIGLVNLALLLLLGVFANKGRAYCQFLCPIGALDALVNRLGSHFRFTRRIRVERNRCTGCNECARKCMCGAIRMVYKVAVVDQLSCMSCHECADVCDWGAIDWLVMSPEIEHKRRKKDVDFHPAPDWVALHRPKSRIITLRRALLAMLFLCGGLFVWSHAAEAAPRPVDPDGCLVCHGLSGLESVDRRGVRRSFSIDTEHYAGSLHGAVPCTDCHREIRSFPHEEDKGVDCAAECHLEEPSKGSSYTHAEVAEEMAVSVHGKGRSAGFSGGNRLDEARDDPNPSCRFCHSNSGYISDVQIPKFRELFQHSDEACGNCHKDDAWRARFTGHILRRLLGGRWSKAEGNRLCIDCHGDRERMSKVERKAAREFPEPASPRFVLATASYESTLHGRLLAVNRDSGAACLDCHAPNGLRHAIGADETTGAATHADRLAQTCAADGCHGFSGHDLNQGFLHTDMHDVDMAPLWLDGWWKSLSGPPYTLVLPEGLQADSNWLTALQVLALILLLSATVWLLGSAFGRRTKGAVYSALGGGAFKRHMLGMRNGNKKRRRILNPGIRRGEDV